MLGRLLGRTGIAAFIACIGLLSALTVGSPVPAVVSGLQSALAQQDCFDDGWGNCVTVPGGAEAFATSVVSYSPGAVGPVDPTFADWCAPTNGGLKDQNGTASGALGVPDVIPANQNQTPARITNDASIGAGGSLTLGFSTPLTGSGDDAPDVWVWEVGPAAEIFNVEVSPDGSNWTLVGQSDGAKTGSQGFDIDDNGFDQTSRLFYIRITDVGGSLGGYCAAGSDIDAVAVLSNIVPDIQLTKSAAPSTDLKAGDVVNYSFLVENTGTDTLSTVAVDDPMPGLSPTTCPNATLLPGQSETCTATYTVTQADVDAGTPIPNTATVSGIPVSGGDPVTDDDTTTITFDQTPGISIDKEANADAALVVGNVVDYTFTVENTGTVTLSDVTVSDPLANLSTISPASVDTLAPGDSTTFTASYTVTQADVDRGELANTATTTGHVPSTCDGCQDPTDSDTNTLPGNPAPALSIDKTADVATGDDVAVGDQITYSYAVTNTGNVTVSDVTVSDPMPGLSDITPASVDTLAPGDSATFTALYTVTQADIDAGSIVNTATANGNPPADCDACGQLVPPTDGYEIDIPQTPGIDLSKTADTDGPVALGDTITYTFTATNTGNVSLSDVTISDDLAGLTWVTGPNLGDLAPGESATGTATYVVTATDVSRGGVANSATVTGTPPESCDCTPPTGGDDIEIPSSGTTGILLNKDANTDGPVALGETITYTFDVTNIGEVNLIDVAVSDPLEGLSAISCPADTLLVGTSMQCTATYTVTQADLDAGRIDNTATATGDPVDGSDPVQDTDDKNIPTDPQVPGIDLEKTADTAGPVAVGDTITYTFTATNTGNVTLSDVTISDELDGLTWVNGPDLGDLAPGDTATGTATYVVTQADVDNGSVYNAATASGTPPDTCVNCPSPSDPDEITIPTEDPAPALGLLKTADTQGPVALGDTITYTLTATNTGNVTIDDVTLSDLLPGLNWVSDPDLGTLAPGESASGTASYVVTVDDIRDGEVDNSATATGDPRCDGCADPSSPPSDVNIPTEDINPSITFEKTADTAGPVSVGDTITYTFTATNTGNVVLYDTTIADDLPGLTWVNGPNIGDLQPGESASGTATYVVTQADVDAGAVSNSATATGYSSLDCSDCDSITSDPSGVTVPTVGTSGIQLVKSADTAGPVAAGDQITYTFTVTNTGAVTLTDLSVDDPLLGTVFCANELGAGESVSCSATYTVTADDVAAGQVVNTATASGTTPDGSTVTDDDSVTVPTLNPCAPVTSFGGGVLALRQELPSTPIVDATDTPADPATDTPTDVATDTPTVAATDTPTEIATDTPTEVATDTPTDEATVAPTTAPGTPEATATDTATTAPGTPAADTPTATPTTDPGTPSAGCSSPTPAPTSAAPTQTPTPQASGNQGNGGGATGGNTGANAGGGAASGSGALPPVTSLPDTGAHATDRGHSNLYVAMLALIVLMFGSLVVRRRATRGSDR